MPCAPEHGSSGVGASLLLALALPVLGCSTAGNAEQPGCPEGSTIERIETSRQLDAAVDTAAAGTCLALVSGSYEAVELPPGVSLVGDGRDVVTLVGVTVNGGEGAALSAFTVRGLGITITGGATGVDISNVHVDDSGADGIDVQPGSAATIVDVEIDDVVGAAVRTTDAAEVRLEDVRFARAAEAGMVARCGSGCDCAATSTVSLAGASIAEVQRLGLHLSGVAATLESVDISIGTSEPMFGAPTAVMATGCARVDGHSLRIVDGDPSDVSLGLLIDGASAHLGIDEARGIEIEGTSGGLWISNVTAALPVQIAFAKLRGNQVVGVGIGPGAAGIVLEQIEVLDTAAVQVPLLVDGMASGVWIGDAVVWHAGAQANIDQLTIAGSGRLGLIVDGPVGAGSRLGKVTLGDSSGPLVQQSVTTTGLLETTAETPPLQTLSTATYPVVDAPYYAGE